MCSAAWSGSTPSRSWCSSVSSSVSSKPSLRSSGRRRGGRRGLRRAHGGGVRARGAGTRRVARGRPARRHRGGDRRLGGRLGGAVPRVRQELWGDHGRHRHDLGAPEHVPDARPPARCSVRDRPAVPHPRRLAARRLLRGAPRRGVVDRDRCAAVRVREPRPLVRSGRRLARGPAARRAGGLRQRDRLRVGLRARAGTQGHLRRLPGRPPTGGGDVFSLRYVAAAKGIRTAAPSCRTARSRRPHRGYHRMHTERAAGLTGPRRHLTIRHHDAREP
jgi:hypothetical protein